MLNYYCQAACVKKIDLQLKSRGVNENNPEWFFGLNTGLFGGNGGAPVRARVDANRDFWRD